MQLAHTHMLHPVSAAPWVADKEPCGPFGADLSSQSGLRLLYIDNFAVLSAVAVGARSAEACVSELIKAVDWLRFLTLLYYFCDT